LPRFSLFAQNAAFGYDAAAAVDSASGADCPGWRSLRLPQLASGP